MSYFMDSSDKVINDLLTSGGLGVLPTDTIYGLSCRALDKKAVDKLRGLKERSHHKPFIVLISNLEMLDLLSIDRRRAKILEKYWPGALSVIFHAPDAPPWLTRGGDTLAVRWPADKKLCELIDRVGPLVSTSANPEGETPAASIEEARKYFGDKPDFYVDAGKLKNKPSTLVRIKGDKLKVIRQGSVDI